MPTTRRRHAITETDAVIAALDTARRAWPHLADKPGDLLKQLIAAGAHALDEADSLRLAAIETTCGALTGIFPHGALEAVRQDWPQ